MKGESTSVPAEESSLENLEKIAEAFASKHAIVDSWLKDAAHKLNSKKKVPPVEYVDSASLARPARLGIGAKPQAQSQKKADAQSVFANYRLKMKLTGQEELSGGVAEDKKLLSLIRKQPLKRRDIKKQLEILAMRTMKIVGQRVLERSRQHPSRAPHHIIISVKIRRLVGGINHSAVLATYSNI